jgi:hypothetical protein
VQVDKVGGGRGAELELQVGGVQGGVGVGI